MSRLYSGKNRSCNDEIATQRIIIKQTKEWQSPLYMCFVDFEVFDSIDRQAIQNILKHYTVPEKTVSIIQQLCYDFACQIIYDGRLLEEIQVTPGVNVPFSHENNRA
uniref:Reverse transcriptase domain-containing protein n=1 Tax=Arion vulgaris TaxID=1028688 RepID=A0A0B6ZBE8_9EUPU